jgi:hypothetical protein
VILGILWIPQTTWLTNLAAYFQELNKP